MFKKGELPLLIAVVAMILVNVGSFQAAAISLTSYKHCDTNVLHQNNGLSMWQSCMQTVIREPAQWFNLQLLVIAVVVVLTTCVCVNGARIKLLPKARHGTWDQYTPVQAYRPILVYQIFATLIAMAFCVLSYTNGLNFS